MQAATELQWVIIRGVGSIIFMSVKSFTMTIIILLKVNIYINNYSHSDSKNKVNI